MVAMIRVSATEVAVSVDRTADPMLIEELELSGWQ